MPDSSIKTHLARLLYKLGFTANALTFLGILLSGISGWLCYQGNFFAASAALLTAGLLDMLDGAVARTSGKADAFGGILDSTLDRYGDGFVLGGLLFFCMRTDRDFYAFLAFMALLGSFSISYVRARAECEIDTCRVGFWERGERIGLLTACLSVQNPAFALWVLAFVTQWTVLERILESRRLIRLPGSSVFGRQVQRGDVSYQLKVILWLALCFFLRPSF